MYYGSVEQAHEEDGMYRFWVGVAAMVIISLTIVGCGGTDDGVAGDTSASETSTSQAPATETSTTATLATTTSTAQAPAGDDWTTIATLRSSDSPWKGLEGILMTEPFTATGEVQLVLDMPDAGEFDGLIVAIIPADKATDDPAELIAAIQDGVVVTLPAATPTKVVSELDGTYVLVNAVPEPKAWTLELQTRP
jgi:hypothetical protein